MSNYTNIEEVLAAFDVIVNDTSTPDAIMGWAGGLANKLTAPLEPLPKYRKGEAIPTTVGAMADLYGEVRARRLELDKEAEACKARETEISKIILDTLSESTDRGASGQNWRVTVVDKERLSVKDWEKFHEFVREKNMFELMQKRLSDKAVADLKEEFGQLPPGVEATDVATLSFNKA